MVLSSLLSTKLGLAIAAAVVPVGGLSAAAFAGALPAPAFGAPSPHATETADATETESAEPAETTTPGPSVTPTSPSATSTESPTGPDATGPAAFGLCNAWSHGGLAPNSVPFKNLAQAAGGTDSIATYCATVVHPGKPSAEPTESESPDDEASESAEPHGKPSDVPPTEHPEGKPSTLPSSGRH